MRPFRNGKGDAVPMILCSETNGNGSPKYSVIKYAIDSYNIQWISGLMIIDETERSRHSVVAS